MGDETITISNGDEITLAPHFDAQLSIKIQNTAFVEPYGDFP